MNNDSKILIVDDTEENIDVLINALGDQYDIRIALNGQRALQLVEDDHPDIILLDVMMPIMDGYEVCKRLKANSETAYIPIIFLTAMSRSEDEEYGLSLGAVDYITKPYNPSLVRVRVENHLSLKMYQNDLKRLVNERTEQLALTQEVTIESMGVLAEYRDPETGGHIRRTQRYVRRLAQYLQEQGRFKETLTDEYIQMLYVSAPLHDIGKVGISDSILLKPGKLTTEEFEVMKNHTVIGYNALKDASNKLGYSTFLDVAKEIAYTHQEKWDGSGYPNQLKGDNIPLSGRLMAIADVYDALISKRIYKPSFTHEKAYEIIVEGRGKHFDPELVDAFIALSEDFRLIALEFADFDEERKNLGKK